MKTTASFVKLLQKKKGFLAAVYATLVLQLVVTFAIVIKLRDYPELSKRVRSVPYIVWIIVFIGLVLCLPFVMMLPPWIKLFVFTLISVLFGFMMHVSSAKLPMSFVERAMIGTMAVFVGMSLAGLALAAIGVDIGFMGLFLFAALVGLLVASLVMLLMQKRRDVEGKLTKGYKALLYIGLVLFSVMIMYDTNMILQRNYGFDFVTAAMDFYFDSMNVFARLLTLQEPN